MIEYKCANTPLYWHWWFHEEHPLNLSIPLKVLQIKLFFILKKDVMFESSDPKLLQTVNRKWFQITELSLPTVLFCSDAVQWDICEVWWPQQSSLFECPSTHINTCAEMSRSTVLTEHSLQVMRLTDLHGSKKLKSLQEWNMWGITSLEYQNHFIFAYKAGEWCMLWTDSALIVSRLGAGTIVETYCKNDVFPQYFYI